MEAWEASSCVLSKWKIRGPAFRIRFATGCLKWTPIVGQNLGWPKEDRQRVEARIA
jgi:hypothetical protein